MVDEQREDLLQRGFEAGMDAGLREGRGAGYWIGAAAAVEGLPPELAAALQRGERSASALTAVATARATLERAAGQRFSESDGALQERAQRFEQSAGASEAGGRSLSPSEPLGALPPDERRALEAWAPQPGRQPGAQRLVLGLPHRVFVPRLAQEQAPPPLAAADEGGKAPQFVCTATAPDGFAVLTPQPPELAALRLPMLSRRPGAPPLLGDVYACDGEALASIDRSVGSAGARATVSVTAAGTEGAVEAQIWCDSGDGSTAQQD